MRFAKDVLKDLDKYRRRYPYFDPVLERGIDWARLANSYVEILLRNPSPSVDFVHIEVLALRLIEQYDFVRRAVEARFPVIAIDEYQDLYYPFHKMACCLLEHTGIKIFAIGDRDQCIYEKLHGTDPKYMDELIEKTRKRNGLGAITLLRNYRCADELIRISEIVIGGPRNYESDTTDGLFVCIDCKGGETAQIQVVLKEILPRILNNSEIPDLSRVAILHPKRRPLKIISNFLGDTPHSLDKEPYYDNACDLTEWVGLMALWCVSGKPYFDEMVPFWIELNKNVGSRNLGEDRFELQVRLFEVLKPLQTLSQGSNVKLRDWFEAVQNGLDLQTLLNRYERVRPDDVSEYKRLEEAVQNPEKLFDWSLTRFAKGPNRIQITTLHSSKGMEFDIVIIIGADQIETHDRRLAYVGVTRARKKVYLLYTGSSPFVNELRARAPKNCHFISRAST